MKLITVLGTRPEIIRLSRLIDKLDESCDHLLVHTGQNFDEKLSDIFFKELSVRAPDYYLGINTSSFGIQAAEIFQKSENLFRDNRPDALLILGDTNSGLSSVVAKRMNIPVYHMEAGNRCYDDRVPEEVNRRIIDHCSTVLMPYTSRSKENLLREGIPANAVHVTGNPIFEVLNHYSEMIRDSDVLEQLSVRKKEYFLATLHRAENVDNPERLERFIKGLELVGNEFSIPVIVSTHPRTHEKLKNVESIDTSGSVQYLDPMGFFDFVHLERNALAVLSDSGTVQEECCIFGVPTVTLRDVTERPETIECGSNILSGSQPEMIMKCVQIALTLRNKWNPPVEYLVEDVSSIVTRIILGYRNDVCP